MSSVVLHSNIVIGSKMQKVAKLNTDPTSTLSPDIMNILLDGKYIFDIAL